MDLGRKPFEHNMLLGLLQHQEPGRPAPTETLQGARSSVLRILTLQVWQQGLPGPVHQADGQGDHQGLLVGLARCGGGVLMEGQLQAAVAAIPVPLNPPPRRTGLGVPAAKPPKA